MSRDEIIAEIRALAAEIGRPPGSYLFETETGIGAHNWRGVHWARWSEALKDAGFEPNPPKTKPDPDLTLGQLADATRRHGRFPTAAEFNLDRRTWPAPSLGTLKRQFGDRAMLIGRLRRWAAERPDYADLAALLPPDPAVQSEAADAIPPAGPAPARGFVRLFRCEARHHLSRIGDADGRRRAPPVALPRTAVLEHAIATDDPTGVEAYWRRRFAYRRLDGDWFALTDQDVAAFKRWREI
jgi:hypothetical protein